MKSLKSSYFVHIFFPTSFVHIFFLRHPPPVTLCFASSVVRSAHLLRPAAFLRPWREIKNHDVKTLEGEQSRYTPQGQVTLLYLWCWLILLFLLLLLFIVFLRVVFSSSCLRSPAAPGYHRGHMYGISRERTAAHHPHTKDTELQPAQRKCESHCIASPTRCQTLAGGISGVSHASLTAGRLVS